MFTARLGRSQLHLLEATSSRGAGSRGRPCKTTWWPTDVSQRAHCVVFIDHTAEKSDFPASLCHNGRCAASSKFQGLHIIKSKPEAFLLLRNQTVSGLHKHVIHTHTHTQHDSLLSFFPGGTGDVAHREGKDGQTATRLSLC